MSKVKVREAVGLFDNMEDLQEAVSDLEVRTFPREHISVMGSHSDIKKKFGTPTVRPKKEVEDNPDMPRAPLVRTEEKNIGTGVLIGGTAYLGAVAAAIAAGTDSVQSILPAAALGGLGGAAIGAVLAKVLGKHFDRNIEDQIKKGGLLLWVRTPDQKHERIASKILRAHGARHVRIHEIAY